MIVMQKKISLQEQTKHLNPKWLPNESVKASTKFFYLRTVFTKKQNIIYGML